MADDSLIEEMRATIRGDWERARQRRGRELLPAAEVQAAVAPDEAPPARDAQQPEAEPDRGRTRPRWLRRRADR